MSVGRNWCCHMNPTALQISCILPKEFNFPKSNKLYYYSQINTITWAHDPGGIQKSSHSFLIRSHVWASSISWTRSPSNGGGQIWARAWALLFSIIVWIRMKEVAWDGSTDIDLVSNNYYMWAWNELTDQMEAWNVLGEENMCPRVWFCISHVVNHCIPTIESMCATVNL